MLAVPWEEPSARVRAERRSSGAPPRLVTDSLTRRGWSQGEGVFTSGTIKAATTGGSRSPATKRERKGRTGAGPGRRYLPEVVADEQFQKLLLELLQGGVQREEHLVQAPRDRLLQARPPEGVPCNRQPVPGGQAARRAGGTARPLPASRGAGRRPGGGCRPDTSRFSGSRWKAGSRAGCGCSVYCRPQLSMAVRCLLSGKKTES